jgi:hypothetical protein
MRTNTFQSKRERVIRASEIGSYSFCAHAWWLSAVEGVRPTNTRHLRAGWAAHEQHGRRVIFGAALSRLSHFLLILAGLAGLAWAASVLIG